MTTGRLFVIYSPYKSESVLEEEVRKTAGDQTVQDIRNIISGLPDEIINAANDLSAPLIIGEKFIHTKPYRIALFVKYNICPETIEETLSTNGIPCSGEDPVHIKGKDGKGYILEVMHSLNPEQMEAYRNGMKFFNLGKTHRVVQRKKYLWD
jgi:hypothetical protein